uniref:Membrane protein ORF125 n=1 Tax=Anguillid herpesvirus 1 TaxID=150286 RepID=A0A8E5AMQ5_9VIRU|nr:membrane protein ORF125 [Anguillid herpesvirus 1]
MKMEGLLLFVVGLAMATACQQDPSTFPGCSPAEIETLLTSFRGEETEEKVSYSNPKFLDNTTSYTVDVNVGTCNVTVLMAAWAEDDGSVKNVSKTELYGESSESSGDGDEFAEVAQPVRYTASVNNCTMPVPADEDEDEDYEEDEEDEEEDDEDKEKERMAVNVTIDCFDFSTNVSWTKPTGKVVVKLVDDQGKVHGRWDVDAARGLDISAGVKSAWTETFTVRVSNETHVAKSNPFTYYKTLADSETDQVCLTVPGAVPTFKNVSDGRRVVGTIRNHLYDYSGVKPTRYVITAWLNDAADPAEDRQLGVDIRVCDTEDCFFSIMTYHKFLPVGENNLCVSVKTGLDEVPTTTCQSVTVVNTCDAVVQKYMESGSQSVFGLIQTTRNQYAAFPLTTASLGTKYYVKNNLETLDKILTRREQLNAFERKFLAQYLNASGVCMAADDLLPEAQELPEWAFELPLRKEDQQLANNPNNPITTTTAAPMAPAALTLSEKVKLSVVCENLTIRASWTLDNGPYTVRLMKRGRPVVSKVTEAQTYAVEQMLPKKWSEAYAFRVENQLGQMVESGVFAFDGWWTEAGDIVCNNPQTPPPVILVDTATTTGVTVMVKNVLKDYPQIPPRQFFKLKLLEPDQSDPQDLDPRTYRGSAAENCDNRYCNITIAKSFDDYWAPGEYYICVNMTSTLQMKWLTDCATITIPKPTTTPTPPTTPTRPPPPPPQPIAIDCHNFVTVASWNFTTGDGTLVVLNYVDEEQGRMAVKAGDRSADISKIVNRRWHETYKVVLQSESGDVTGETLIDFSYHSGAMASFEQRCTVQLPPPPTMEAVSDGVRLGASVKNMLLHFNIVPKEVQLEVIGLIVNKTTDTRIGFTMVGCNTADCPIDVLAFQMLPLGTHELCVNMTTDLQGRDEYVQVCGNVTVSATCESMVSAYIESGEADWLPMVKETLEQLDNMTGNEGTLYLIDREANYVESVLNSRALLTKKERAILERYLKEAGVCQYAADLLPNAAPIPFWAQRRAAVESPQPSSSSLGSGILITIVVLGLALIGLIAIRFSGKRGRLVPTTEPISAPEEETRLTTSV